MNEMEAFRDRLSEAFARCPFADRKPLVFGEGNLKPRLLLIGEAPGEQEALQGRPFVGKAGKNLDVFLETLELPRETIYITNVVKFRPWAVSKAGNLVNRPPKKEEIAFFQPYLLEEISLMRPEILVTLGNVALHAFLPQSIGECHGRLLSPEGITAKLFPLYHPASVIYNRKLGEVYQQDLQKLKSVLASLPLL